MNMDSKTFGTGTGLNASAPPKQTTEAKNEEKK
jgi:hypothetical protein